MTGQRRPRPIAFLEGIPCLGEGVVQTWKTAPDPDFTYILISPVILRRIDDDGLATGDEIYLDHLWVHVSTRQFLRFRKASMLTRLKRHQILGRVCKYQRSDGSEDYSLGEISTVYRWSVVKREVQDMISCGRFNAARKRMGDTIFCDTGESRGQFLAGKRALIQLIDSRENAPPRPTKLDILSFPGQRRSRSGFGG